MAGCFGVVAVISPVSSSAVLADAAAAEEPTAAQDAAEAILQIEGDIAYGQFLASECLTCHQESGATDGIPAIVGIAKDYFVLAVVEYQTNVRDSDVMRVQVASLGGEEIAALAAYLGTLDPK